MSRNETNDSLSTSDLSDEYEHFFSIPLNEEEEIKWWELNKNLETSYKYNLPSWLYSDKCCILL